MKTVLFVLTLMCLCACGELPGGVNPDGGAVMPLPPQPPDNDPPITTVVYQERFESWTTESVPGGWRVTYGSPWTNIIRSSAAYSGLYALALKSDGAASVGIASGVFPVEPGQTYTGSFKTSLPSADPTAEIRDHFRVMIYWLRSDGSCATDGGQWCLAQDWEYTDDVHQDTGFVQHTKSFVVPGDAAKAYLWIYDTASDLQVMDNVLITTVL